MTPDELKVRRAALGLSQARLADWLGVSQDLVSKWENGKRAIPAGITADLDDLEQDRNRLANRMVEALEHDPGAPLIVHMSDDTLRAAHPEMDGIPHEVQQIAAALAASRARVRPLIVGVAG